MVGHIIQCYIYTTVITVILLLIGPNLLCNSIRLEYRPSLGKVFTYSEIQTTEVSDPDEDTDYSIQRQETTHAERIVDVNELEDGIITIEIQYSSVEITPPNERKKKNLLASSNRVKMNRYAMIQTALASTLVGNVNNVFPLHDVDVGDSWTTTMDALGKGNTRYTLVSVDESLVATIDCQSTYNILEGLTTFTISATWKIDSKTGITITRDETNIIQVMSKRTVMTKSTKLIAQE
ncbi:unnamed protein product [Adineta steineri]|uniref:Uncharacterized protein n=1 Tax=Adineta steineri TaxID=433720 RepID=A0A814KAX6_9BILA|nr:unnamed protein product [Adineta steineri]CAF3919089.1 unnamed protein product [Adineta steineri]